MRTRKQIKLQNVSLTPLEGLFVFLASDLDKVVSGMSNHLLIKVTHISRSSFRTGNLELGWTELAL